MSRKSQRAFGDCWLALMALLMAACGMHRTTPLEHSLKRTEELLVILEEISSESDANAAAPYVAGWVAGWELHNHHTAGLESVSGPAYVAMLESTSSRADGLRLRLQRQVNRLPEESYLERYRSHVSSALAILPPAVHPW